MHHPNERAGLGVPLRRSALVGLVSGILFSSPLFAKNNEPPVPVLLESVVPADSQPHSSSPAVIFYDSFDGPDASQAVYLEPSIDSPHADRSSEHALGGRGMSMECFYPQGEKGIGNRKLVFGDGPFGKPVRDGESFEEIYWRIYVKHQRGWIGEGPAKMSRAAGFVSPQWNQAFILHVWGSGECLTLDPVSGVEDGKVITTCYNDFDRFDWLGNRPHGKFPIHSTENSGRWICVEAHLKLNTPGEKDGYAALWIDGRLDTERRDMDFRGNYTDHLINAVFLEAYWNAGSPVDQYRWYDDFVVSTEPIGPVTAGRPVEIQVDCRPEVASWQLQIAENADSKQLVWQSDSLSGDLRNVRLDDHHGQWLPPVNRKTDVMYFCRSRFTDRSGKVSSWSRWQQPFFLDENHRSISPSIKE